MVASGGTFHLWLSLLAMHSLNLHGRLFYILARCLLVFFSVILRFLASVFFPSHSLLKRLKASLMERRDIIQIGLGKVGAQS